MGCKRSSSSVCDTISKISGETVRAMSMQAGGEHGTPVFPGSRSSTSSSNKAEVEKVLRSLTNAGLCTHGRDLGINFDPYQVRSSQGLGGGARGEEHSSSHRDALFQKARRTPVCSDKKLQSRNIMTILRLLYVFSSFSLF